MAVYFGDFFPLSLFFCARVKPLSRGEFVWFLRSPGAAAAGFILTHCKPALWGPTVLRVSAVCRAREAGIRSAGLTDVSETSSSLWPVGGRCSGL